MRAEEERPRPVDGVWGRDLGEEYLFYEQDGDRVHVLNATARAIYLLCDGTRTTDDVVGSMSDRYDIDEPTLRRDVGEVIRNLIDLKLLTLA